MCFVSCYPPYFVCLSVVLVPLSSTLGFYLALSGVSCLLVPEVAGSIHGEITV